jgi:4-amino-4-deoxy-L-arabinose transferase-like glycosyltransferase
MSIKKNFQLKLASFAQKGKWNSKLVTIISSPLFWILMISGIVRLIYYSVLLNTKAYDSAGYINYRANILLGQTEGLRTPVYPYFIKLIGLFGSHNLVDNIITAQIIISFLSIILFYKVVKALFKKRAVIFAASLLYGVMLPVINFDKLVLTESFAVIFSLIFIYLLVSYLKKPAHAKAWVLTLFVFIAIMLRPSFICLFPLAIAFWFLRLTIFRKDWKMCLSGLAASVVVMLLITGYSNLNKKNAGFNGISVVSNHNELAVIVKASLYPYGNDTEITEAIKTNIELAKQHGGRPMAGVDVIGQFAPDRIHKFIVNCIRNQPGAYAYYVGSTLLDLQAANIFTNYPDHKLSYLAFRINNIEYLIFCVTFNMLYFFIVLDLVMIVTGWIKGKQAPWFKIMLWLLIVAQVAVAVMGGYNEYQRLILPAMPGLIILLFSYIDKIFFAIDKGKLAQYSLAV